MHGGGRLRAAGPIGVVVAVFVVLLFARLGDRSLWEDEAQTALLGRKVLAHGAPRFEPGESLPTDRADRADFDARRTFVWNTWLPFYLVAASFGLFGESELSARLPFALAGAAGMLVFLALCRHTGRSGREMWVALLLLALSVPLLLHLRQCRYYALALLGTLWTAWGYVRLCDGARRAWAHVAAGSLMSFASFYVTPALNFAALVAVSLSRADRRRTLRGLLLAASAFALAALPGFVRLRLWAHPAEERAADVATHLYVNLLWLNGFVVPLALPVVWAMVLEVRGRGWWVFAYAAFLAGAVREELRLPALATLLLLTALAARGLLQWRRERSADGGAATTRGHSVEGLALALIVTYVVVLSVVAPYPFYRYLVPVVPLALILAARGLNALAARSAPLGWGLLGVMIVSNALSTLPLRAAHLALAPQGRQIAPLTVVPHEPERWLSLRSDLASFLGELIRGVRDPEEVLVAFIGERASAGQVVKASYDDITLMYYCPDLRVLSRHEVGDGVPDFIVPRGPYRLAVSERYEAEVRRHRFESVSLGVPNAVWSNRPDPLFHRYATATGGQELVVHVKRGLRAEP